MSDLISRQQAIDALTEYGNGLAVFISVGEAVIRIEQLPSAQPTFDARDTQYNLPIGTDLISRQVAVDALRKMQTYKLFSGDDMLLIDQAGAMTELMLLPPAQPESFEWCTDCKEYDQESHCCHRWSKVISKTVDEMQVVRCKDCIYADYMDDVKALWCSEGGGGKTVAPDDFCSYGAKMEVTT